MSTPEPNPPPTALAILQSPILRGVIVALVTHIVAALHLSAKVAPADIANWADVALETITVLALVRVFFARVGQTSAPQITVTKKQADAINSAAASSAQPEEPK
jgi:hypothetical protein